MTTLSLFRFQFPFPFSVSIFRFLRLQLPDEILNPNRIKTTINLVKFILRGNPFPLFFVTPDSGSRVYMCDEAINPIKWKTVRGDDILQLVGSSEICISHIPSAVVLKILNSHILAKYIVIKPDCRTSDGDNILELACQSEMYLSQTPSGLILKWLGDATINQVIKSIPDSKTADGRTLIELVCKSEICISHISTAVLSKWLSDTTLTRNLAAIITPEWKTADDDTVLKLVCQSEACLSRISSAVLLNWLSNVTLFPMYISLPDSKTVDGDTPLQLVYQSKTTVSQTSSAVLSKWLDENALDLLKVITPDWKTADGDTLLQLVCQSQTCMSQTSSAILLKWLDETALTALDFSKVTTPDWKTADGDTLLQLIYQSETLLSQISSAVLLQWFVSVCIPSGCKVTDSDTLLQLILQSESSISKTPSKVLSMWLSDGREITVDQNLIQMADPKWKTLDGDCFFHALCQSETEDKKLIKLIQHYIQKDCLNPDTVDSNGNTALHIACQADKPELVSFLLNEAQCDPCKTNKMGSLPLDLTTNLEVINYICQCDQNAVYSKAFVRWMNNYASIDDKAMLCILRPLVDNHIYKTQDGSTLLHLICNDVNGIFRDKKRLIHYLLTEGCCDPNCLDSKGQMSLQLTSDPRIMKTLVDHGAKVTTDVVFKVVKCITDSKATKLLNLSINKGTMIWNPTELNNNGDTTIHLAYKLDKPAIVNCLLGDIKRDPNANNHLESLLEQTTNLEIAKMLIRHSARVTPEMVLRFEAMEASENKPKLIKLMITTWNPNDKDSDGYTALHLACKADNPTTVNLLLSVAHCDPNITSKSEEVPLQMTTNTEIIKDLIRHGAKTSIMYESYQNSLGTNKPVQPPVKVFIVGNPSVGKSTLTAALKKELGIIARMFSGKVSGVDKKTVGIVPHDIESDTFGRITLYDFAGHREFYSGHAALLQTAIQSTPPIFLLVINFCEDKSEIVKNILYWISFLENQCASVSCKPHIILVGSHADTLRGVNPKDKIKTIIDSLDAKCFINMVYIGFVPMNCQYHESTGMSDLRCLLIKSCQELRIHEPITFNAHCFLVFMIDTFTNLTAVTIKDISETIEIQQSRKGVLEFLPEGIETLYKICLELNDRGHILLLKDRFAIENSYIVIDKEFLLSRLSGTVFAPEGFKQYKELSTNTGVVPLSKITEIFPNQDHNVLIGFLTHLEFCHEISDQSLHQLISEQYSRVSGERYYLFPGLISVKVDDTVWQMQSEYDYSFGWILKCNYLDQFFNSRFLQVLLLRLAFSFALNTSGVDPSQSIGIHRKCCLWKNGIFWGRTFAMQTLVEVAPDNKSVLLLARFQEDDLLQCVHHRSKVINTILQCKEQFCPRIQTTELFLDSSSPHQYPLNLPNESNICTLQDLATAVVSDSKSRRVVLQCATIPAKNYLSFDPYLEMRLSTIQELWDETNEKKVVSESCLLRLVQQATDELRCLIKTIIGTSIGEDQLYQDLLRWRDSDKTKQKTYKEVHQKVDQYSVFAGRNVLVSYNILSVHA